jgi:prevent-host-death family protein
VTNNETTISVRDLKAHASKLLKLIEEDSGTEIIITRHGKPCGKLVGLEQLSSPAPTPPVERISLRNSMSHLANTGEKDLVEATNIWGSGSNE